MAVNLKQQLIIPHSHTNDNNNNNNNNKSTTNYNTHQKRHRQHKKDENNNNNENELNYTLYHPLIICICDELQHIPLESMPILLNYASSICRIPCFEFATMRVYQCNAKQRLRKNNNTNKLNDTYNCYYILNPNGDLNKTQERFETVINEQIEFEKEFSMNNNNNNNNQQHSNDMLWNGIKGYEPNDSNFENGLIKNDLFLYVGHNGGEQFISCYKIEQFDINAISLLMGCSSGLLKRKGFYQSTGLANSYMIAQSPIVVANLWDVTDKDIDQFSIKLLTQSVFFYQNNNNNNNYNSSNNNNIICVENHLKSISDSVAISRNECKLKYLNGAAPVCYGIPYHLIHGMQV